MQNLLSRRYLFNLDVTHSRRIRWILQYFDPLSFKKSTISFVMWDDALSSCLILNVLNIFRWHLVTNHWEFTSSLTAFNAFWRWLELSCSYRVLKELLTIGQNPSLTSEGKYVGWPTQYAYTCIFKNVLTGNQLLWILHIQSIPKLLELAA